MSTAVQGRSCQPTKRASSFTIDSLISTDRSPKTETKSAEYFNHSDRIHKDSQRSPRSPDQKEDGYWTKRRCVEEDEPANYQNGIQKHSPTEKSSFKSTDSVRDSSKSSRYSPVLSPKRDSDNGNHTAFTDGLKSLREISDPLSSHARSGLPHQVTTLLQRYSDAAGGQRDPRPPISSPSQFNNIHPDLRLAAQHQGLLRLHGGPLSSTMSDLHHGVPAGPRFYPDLGCPPHLGGQAPQPIPGRPPGDSMSSYYAWLLSRHSGYLNQRFMHPGGPAALLFPFRKPKRIRTAFSPSQLLQLEDAFVKNHYVVGQERKNLAASLNLSETQVKVWFQNRRTKHKRAQSDDGTGSENENNDDVTSCMDYGSEYVDVDSPDSAEGHENDDEAQGYQRGIPPGGFPPGDYHPEAFLQAAPRLERGNSQDNYHYPGSSKQNSSPMSHVNCETTSRNDEEIGLREEELVRSQQSMILHNSATRVA